MFTAFLALLGLTACSATLRARDIRFFRDTTHRERNDERKDFPPEGFDATTPAMQ